MKELERTERTNVAVEPEEVDVTVFVKQHLDARKEIAETELGNLSAYAPRQSKVTEAETVETGDPETARIVVTTTRTLRVPLVDGEDGLVLTSRLEKVASLVAWEAAIPECEVDEIAIELDGIEVSVRAA